MPRLLPRTRARIRDATKPLGEAAVGALTIGMLRTTRYFDPIKTANLFGRITRLIGPRLREQRIGRANLTAAFPEKSPEEIDDHSRRRLGQSRPRRRRVRPSRSHLGARSGAPRGQPHRNPAAYPRTVCAAAARRQAGADLCKPSRQLGTAGSGGGRPRPGCGDPVSPAQHRLGRPHHRARSAR